MILQTPGEGEPATATAAAGLAKANEATKAKTMLMTIVKHLRRGLRQQRKSHLCRGRGPTQVTRLKSRDDSTP